MRGDKIDPISFRSRCNLSGLVVDTSIRSGYETFAHTGGFEGDNGRGGFSTGTKNDDWGNDFRNEGISEGVFSGNFD